MTPAAKRTVQHLARLFSATLPVPETDWATIDAITLILNANKQ
jgi:hypothetical protein